MKGVVLVDDSRTDLQIAFRLKGTETTFLNDLVEYFKPYGESYSINQAARDSIWILDTILQITLRRTPLTETEISAVCWLVQPINTFSEFQRGIGMNVYANAVDAIRLWSENPHDEDNWIDHFGSGSSDDVFLQKLSRLGPAGDFALRLCAWRWWQNEDNGTNDEIDPVQAYIKAGFVVADSVVLP